MKLFIFISPNGLEILIKAQSEQKAREQIAILYGSSEGYILMGGQG